GQITCKNIENWGVLFEFWLPKIADLPGIYASKGDELQEEAQSHFNNGHIHTLFVDDDPIYQDHFKTQFDSISIPGISFSLVICSSSEEALATYMHCKPDLIISDGFLGSNSLCDGRSLLKVINQLSPYAQTILYSSHFNKNDVKERTLNKPASALEIKNHILRTLELSITNHQKLSHG
ncbi:MAG: response regulator, partial [Proteobacteria bacterium]|nr:response regulator [Pseudomonadota bacterium]